MLSSVHIYIYFDCLGALDKVKNLPPHRIPSKCCYSDVLKNIMIHCLAMALDCLFSHVSAHQDDREDFENLSRQAQLNLCGQSWRQASTPQLGQEQPSQATSAPPGLKAITVWAGKERMTSNSGSSIRYHAHKNLAREELDAAGMLSFQQFGQVD